jgi:hypothetical protein
MIDSPCFSDSLSFFDHGFQPLIVAFMAINYDLEKLARFESIEWTGNHFFLLFWVRSPMRRNVASIFPKNIVDREGLVIFEITASLLTPYF